MPNVAGEHFVVVCNPENRRLAFFQEALAAAGQPPADVVSWLDLLRGVRGLPLASGQVRGVRGLPLASGQGRRGHVSLADRLRPGSIVRLESPGENFEVERECLRRGIEAAEADGVPVLAEREIDRLVFDRGRILHPRQAYLGFGSLLLDLHDDIASVPGVVCFSRPADVANMFDKPMCHTWCEESGIPVPRSPGVVHSYEELRTASERAGMRRGFVKLANGSSASGVVALLLDDDHPRAVTSAELVREGGRLRLYNSLRLRTYTNERDIADLVDELCRHRVHVEEWLPKAHPDERGNVDLRVLVIGGRAAHVVARQSRSPLTNLHLGNRRADVKSIRQCMPPDQWAAMMASCERAAGLFPDTLHAAVDVMPLPGFRRHAVAEINAFGDLLPGVVWNGMDTYAAEIAAVLERPPLGA